VQAGPAGASAGTLATELGIPPATMSFHLKELRSAGLADCERQGRSRIYRSDFAAMRDLVGYLTENCCRGVDGNGPGEGCEFDSTCVPTP